MTTPVLTFICLKTRVGKSEALFRMNKNLNAIWLTPELPPRAVETQHHVCAIHKLVISRETGACTWTETPVPAPVPKRPAYMVGTTDGYKMFSGIPALDKRLGEGIVLHDFGMRGQKPLVKFKDPRIYMEGCYCAKTTSTQVETSTETEE